MQCCWPECADWLKVAASTAFRESYRYTRIQALSPDRHSWLPRCRHNGYYVYAAEGQGRRRRFWSEGMLLLTHLELLLSHGQYLLSRSMEPRTSGSLICLLCLWFSLLILNVTNCKFYMEADAHQLFFQGQCMLLLRKVHIIFTSVISATHLFLAS